jgi:hypothetical protein
MRNTFIILTFLCLQITLTNAQPDFKRFHTETGGIVLAHSPKISNIFLGSPSICILPNGNYVASHDIFGVSVAKKLEPMTKIHISKNKGKTWKHIANLNHQYWSNLFVLNRKLYIIGTTKSEGNISIRKSDDGGLTWTEPTDTNNGLLAIDEPFHCGPVPVVVHNGRIWRAMEDCSRANHVWGKMFRTFMLSAPINADLLKSSNWTFSTRLPYDSTYLNGKFGGWLEGNAVVSPDGKIVNVLRVDYREKDGEKAALVHISDDGKTASFNPEKDFINLPGGCKKFTIRYDKTSKKYWMLSNYVPDEFKGGNAERTRNTQALSWSSDLRNWNIHRIVLQHKDVAYHGFQYLDWQFDGNDIIALSRTAYDDGMGGADNQHNANMITFHRIKDFRK